MTVVALPVALHKKNKRESLMVLVAIAWPRVKILGRQDNAYKDNDSNNCRLSYYPIYLAWLLLQLLSGHHGLVS